jgi:hypothetical protein
VDPAGDAAAYRIQFSYGVIGGGNPAIDMVFGWLVAVICVAFVGNGRVFAEGESVPLGAALLHR